MEVRLLFDCADQSCSKGAIEIVRNVSTHESLRLDKRIPTGWVVITKGPERYLCPNHAADLPKYMPPPDPTPF